MTAALPVAAMLNHTLTGLDYMVLAIYFALNVLIGWWVVRKRKMDNNEFFLGGRRIGWKTMGLSFAAAHISILSFMGLPAKTFTSDWLVFGSAPAQAAAGVIVGVVFVGILRRLNLTTIFGYLERRFDTKVRLLAACLAILMKVASRMAVIMLLPALALSTVTGLNVYVSILVMGVVTTIYAVEGGFKAMIWTDVMHFVIICAGVGVALYYMAVSINGGLAGVVHTGESAGKFRMVLWDWSATKPTFWVFFGMFLGHVFTQLADQSLMQRMLASPNVGEAQRTVVTGNLLGMVTQVVFLFVGTALYVFYRAHPERLANMPSNDAILPYFIVNELPHGMVGLMVAALFAAAMGVLSSSMNSAAAIVMNDFQGRWFPQATPANQLRYARLATLVFGVLATSMAAFYAFRNVSSLWDESLKVNALLGGGLQGVFALGLLTRRANVPGAIIGAAGSLVVTWWIQHYTLISVYIHSFLALVAALVIGYLASLCFKATRRDLQGLTVWDLRRTA